MLAGGLHSQANGESPTTDSMVFTAFPEADSYRRIVRDVDQQARTTIERALPFKVHFDELGPHTLLVAFRGRQPVGLLYLRSEESEWGLTEIAWALSLDLRVLGFQFLRGRSRHIHELQSSGFAKLLVGRDLTQLVEVLAKEGKRDPNLVPAGAEDLARTMLRSGIKALLVTDTVWRDEIAKMQDLSMGFDVFPGAERFHRKVARFDLTSSDDPSKVSANIVRATGKGNSHLGSVVRTEAMVDGNDVVLRWIVDERFRIVRIVPAQSWANDALRLHCAELEGAPLSSPPAGKNPLSPLARRLGEVLANLNTSKGGG